MQYFALTFITPVEERHRVASCAAHIETHDRKFVLVALSGKSMNGYGIEHVGGVLEKPLPLKNGRDLFKHLYKEIKEEARIYKKDLKNLYLKKVVQGQRGAVHFIFKTKLKITSTELKQRFKQNRKKDPDIGDLLILERSEYLDYLNNCRRSVKKVMVGLMD